MRDAATVVADEPGLTTPPEVDRGVRRLAVRGRAQEASSIGSSQMTVPFLEQPVGLPILAVQIENLIGTGLSKCCRHPPSPFGQRTMPQVRPSRHLGPQTGIHGGKNDMRRVRQFRSP